MNIVKLPTTLSEANNFIVGMADGVHSARAALSLVIEDIKMIPETPLERADGLGRQLDGPIGKENVNPTLMLIDPGAKM